MGIGNISSFEARTQNIRAGMRVNSRVPVAVEWAESGRAMRAEGYTADTSTKGCLAIIPQSFPVGQRLRPGQSDQQECLRSGPDLARTRRPNGMGTGAGTSRSFDGFLGLGFLDDAKHGPCCVLSVAVSSVFLRTLPRKDLELLRMWFSQNRTSEISTDPAVNFHFSLALEWVANVEWA